ncbi:Tat (twin-arginine translocation) pathway signal sequence containing protein [Pedobacter lusitanus]|uniref:Tat (Twin-arginine translocation) pathway signal sequence containing protein n=1 Tax=Pedobacter lusitanus TaxID=1503925 RepID=A0A0D0GDU0_9SPHI|nr:ferritin-like domain-containing protein [Pedobacter lusitanus]KIO75507.1 Tat (twin-arginine translocation) pathway signal sequence containing protein [Pedobacter lusitanus]
MKSLQEQETELLQRESGILTAKLQRRSFLQYAGAGVAGAALIAAGCKKDHNTTPGLDTGVDLGSGDPGILNYAYALEQLEGAFYDAVVKTPYANISAAELALLTDIRDHELAHREFFKKALGTGAIQNLEVNFSSINFADRASVLGTAKAFEDLGVSAYNGAGKLLKSSEYLLIAGKIVSVEARHAALIRDLISNGTFADSTAVDANGLDGARTPVQVLTIAKAYLKTSINASNLPS